MLDQRKRGSGEMKGIRQKQYVALFTICLAGTFVATPASANMILSMPFLVQSMGFFGLIPVLIVEVLIASRVTRRLGHRVDTQDIVAGFLIANILSFIFGVIVVFFLEGALMYIQFLPQEGFLNQLLYELEYPEARIGLATDLALLLAVLLVFLPNWLIEAAIIRKFFAWPGKVALRIAFWANAGSYLMIFVFMETLSFLG